MLGASVGESIARTAACQSRGHRIEKTSAEVHPQITQISQISRQRKRHGSSAERIYHGGHRGNRRTQRTNAKTPRSAEGAEAEQKVTAKACQPQVGAGFDPSTSSGRARLTANKRTRKNRRSSTDFADKQAVAAPRKNAQGAEPIKKQTQRFSSRRTEKRKQSRKGFTTEDTEVGALRQSSGQGGHRGGRKRSHG